MLIPFRTDRPRLRRAYLTAALIAVNSAIHLWCWGSGGVLALPGPAPVAGPPHYPPEIERFGLWPGRPTWEALVGHMFLHADPLHLAGNMLFLWVFGSLLEEALRPWGLALLYFGGGIAAAAAHCALAGLLGAGAEVPLIGASGAVAAVMGLFLFRFHRTGVDVFYWLGWRYRGTFRVAAVWALLYWIGIEAAGAVMDALIPSHAGVAHWAHVGGFAAGAAAAGIMGSLAAARREYVTDDPAANVERLRRLEEAERLRRELRREPANPYVLHRLAGALRRAGERREAVERSAECVALFCRRGLLAQAAAAYREAAACDVVPLDPEVRLAVAGALEGPDLSLAVAAYRAIAMEHPTHAEAGRALLRLAELYERRLEQPYEALHCLTEITRRYPNGECAEEARRRREQLQLRMAGGAPA